MKICLYTISDLKPESLECINMLYESIFSQKINQNNNIDFYVVGNNALNINIQYNYICSEYKQNHIVYSRYTNNLPEGYDKYIYLDSDILFFDNVLSLINNNYEFGIVTEGGSGTMNEIWFKYPFSQSKDNEIFNYLPGINSGTFIFSNKTELKNISKLFLPYLNLWKDKSGRENAIFEQSCFNYFLALKYGQSLLAQCDILTDKIQLHCSNLLPQKNKKIYHFMGFDFGMAQKVQFMKKFKLEYYKSII